MAITPLSLSRAFSGTPRFPSIIRPDESMVGARARSKTPIQSSVVSITDNLQTVKTGSLLYQIVSRLLLTPEQDKQLSDSLEKMQGSQPTESQSIESVEQPISSNLNINQFSLIIELSILNVNQQTLIINDQSGQFIRQTTVVEAFSMRLEISFGPQTEEVSDPLIIDVKGDGFTTSGIESGVAFDIDADGFIDQVSIPTTDDAFLALDVNGNGIIDNGSELFGDQTGYQNGFEYLASFDDNNDNKIDANDRIFNSLLMMRLINNDQFITQLSETTIQSINLGYTNTSTNTDSGDRIVQMSDYKNSDGQKGVIADLLLQYKSGLNKS